jgi:hypothetical protein
MGLSLKDKQLLARNKQRASIERRRQKFLVVAAALRRPSEAQDIVRLAKLQVAKWRTNKLCSADYIQAWEDLLKDPQRAAEVLESSSPSAFHLQQNSPFVAVVKALHAA